MSTGEVLPDVSRLAPGSDYWDDDQPVLLNHHRQPDVAVPVFGDASRWDLHALGWNPAAGRHSAVLLFESFTGELMALIEIPQSCSSEFLRSRGQVSAGSCRS